MALFVYVLLCVSFPVTVWSAEVVLPDIIDMTRTLQVDKVLYYPASPEGFNMTNVWRGNTTLRHGAWVEVNRFSTIIHLGTHMDAPCHFCTRDDCWRMHEVPFENLRGPAAVFDVTSKCKENPTYEMTVNDIEKWIEENGAIPDGAMIMITTGAHEEWPGQAAYFGPNYKNHSYEYPGLSPEAVRYFLDKANIKGVGIDWGSVDSSLSGGPDADKEYYAHAHRALLGQNKLLFEYVNNIHVLPPTGYTIYANPLKLYDTCGSPLRMLAIKNPVSGATQLSAGLTMFNTGGQDKWPDWEAYFGPNYKNRSIIKPGLSPDAVQYFLEKANIKGVGVDWGGVDSSLSAGPGADKEYYQHAHRALLGNNKLIFEYVSNIHLLPPTGYTIYANPLKLYDTCGSPLRMFAIKNPESSAAQLSAVLTLVITCVMWSIM